MHIMQTITDYIMRSILTTHGDLVVRGAAIPERLAAVAVGQVLKSTGINVKPVYGVPSMLFVPNYTDDNVRAAAGAEVITGVGFMPRLIFFVAVDNTVTNINWAVGVSTLTSDNCLEHYDYTPAVNLVNGVAMRIRRSAGDNLSGVVSARGSDGFTITWTLNGTCAITYRFWALG